MAHAKLKQFLASTTGQLFVLVGSVAYNWLEPITIRLTEDPDLNFTKDDISWMVAILQAGEFISSLISGQLTNRVGRKYMIVTIAPLCLVGWVIILCSKTMLALILVRILHGMAVGVCFTIPPIYTAEIAEPRLRGRLSGTFMVAWYLGTLYSYCFGPFLSFEGFVYVCLPLPILFTIISTFMPETPHYLLMCGKEDEARKVLQYFREGDVEEELKEMKRAVGQEMSSEGSWKTLFTDRMERKAFIIVQIVCVAKSLGGLVVLTNYALVIFSDSDSFLSPGIMSILFAIFLTLITIVAGLLSDGIGRRPLLLVSCYGSFVSHFVTGIFYYIHEETTIDSSNITWALYIGLSAYCFFIVIGLGPLLQTLQSEMFISSTRGVAAGFTEGFAAILCFLALKFFTPVNEAYGMYVSFWFFSLINLMGGILLSWLLYETAGKTIGQMVDRSNNIVL